MAEGHLHKLKRHKYKNGTQVFFCSNNCNFKVETALALGKITLCNICSEPFKMTELTCRMVRPHCSSCGRVRVKTEDGSFKLISKNQMKLVAEGLASNTIQSLKSRLAAVVTIEKDEDI